MRYLFLILALIASPAYAQYDNSYQAVEARSEAENARISQDVDMQNMQNHMNEMQQQQYQQPVQQTQQYQPVTTNTMYGTVYTGPGSGFPQ